MIRSTDASWLSDAPEADGTRYVSLRNRTFNGLDQWSFVLDAGSSTTGRVVNSATAQCLGVVGGSVELMDCAGQRYQRWRFDRKANGVVVPHLLATDEVLDVPGFGKAQGLRAIAYPFNDGYNQWWRIG